MTTATAQAFANIAFIKYWGNKEMYLTSRKPTIKMLWSKDRTLLNRYFPVIKPSSDEYWQNSIELMARVVLGAKSTAPFHIQ